MCNRFGKKQYKTECVFRHSIDSHNRHFKEQKKTPVVFDRGKRKVLYFFFEALLSYLFRMASITACQTALWYNQFLHSVSYLHKIYTCIRQCNITHLTGIELCTCSTVKIHIFFFVSGYTQSVTYYADTFY